MQGKQAKMLSLTQERAILGYLATTRYPHRDRVMFLLSIKAGLRAKEMASLTWAMVTDAEGQLMETMHLDVHFISSSPVELWLAYTVEGGTRHVQNSGAEG